MNKKGGLLAHTRSGAKVKKKAGFLDLAGELRNQIYDYCFRQCFICEFAGKDAQLRQRQPKIFKFSRPRMYYQIHEVEFDSATTVRFPRVLGRYERIQGLDTHWNTSLTGLVFVCKQVHTETIGFLYRKTTFAFDSPNRIINFLKVPSAMNLTNVTKIELHYNTYGDPKKSENLQWKQKHIDSWGRTCKAVATQLINLQQIHIWLHISESTVRLDIHEPYLKPIFLFRKYSDPKRTRAKTLSTAIVRINTIWNKPGAFLNKELRLASEHLHCLFEEAISRVILGATQEAAMVDFNNAWENTYARWHHHLQFAVTGW